MKCTPAGMCGPTSRSTASFTEPTSLTVAPAFSAGFIACASSALAPIGAHRMTRSASLTAAASVSCTLSQILRRSAAPRVAAEREQHATCPATPAARAARAIDEPISPMPTSATRR